MAQHCNEGHDQEQYQESRAHEQPDYGGNTIGVAPERRQIDEQCNERQENDTQSAKDCKRRSSARREHHHHQENHRRDEREPKARAANVR